MACKQHLCLLAISFASFFCAVLADCDEDDLYIIKSAGNSDLVLEGKDSSLMTVQYFSNSPSQLWRFDKGSNVGYFYIINNQTGRALDLEGENSRYQLVLAGKPKRITPRQQWNLGIDGRIQNRENRRCIDIYKAIFVPGTRVIMVQCNGSPAQIFQLQKYKDFDLEEWKESQSADGGN